MTDGHTSTATHPWPPASVDVARETVTVAINAQVNPANAGGAESAIRGLLAHLAAQASLTERFVVLATGRYAADFEQLAGAGQEVLAWPFPQPAHAPFRTMTRRWQRVQRRAGPLGFGVDAAHRVWWHARQALTRPPTPALADRQLRARGVRVVHFPYAVHFPTSLPIIYEPLDLQHRHLPEFFSPGERRWRDAVYRDGCERARLIVTGTRHIKQDIVGEYGIDPRRIAVIPIRSALPPTPPTPADIARVRPQYNLPDRFLLYPAMTFPHKNHLRLFEALAILRDRHGITLYLVCTGRPYESHWPALQEALTRFGLTGQVKMLGSVPQPDLVALFGSAWALAFPSLFEGIGLPVIEALQYGLPVISSNVTSLPEVAGDAALYFDPTSVESIVDTLMAAHQQPGLLERCRQAAPAVLARFDWQRAARTYVACYRAAAGVSLSPDEHVLFDEAVSS
jgi:glycosyltransferase involved in cell wall biosynthesis